MKILRDGQYFGIGDDLQTMAEVAGDDVLRYSFDPDDYREYRLSHINDACEVELARLKASYPQSEVISWDKQEREARALTADPNASTPLLDGIATQRSINRQSLADRVIVLADQYTQSIGAVLGKRQSLAAQLYATHDTAVMKQIKW